MLAISLPPPSRPLVQIPVFVTFVGATRALIDSDNGGGNAGGGSAGMLGAPGASRLGLASGGALWFGDLTARDRTLALPLSAAALTYANIEVL